jgi:hypothetical protein
MANVDASDPLRLAADYSLLGRVMLGECPYAVYVVLITNDQINFNTLPTVPTLTPTRITVCEGYLSFAPGDGYLNPPIRQLSGEQLVLSGGALTDNLVSLGPLSFPYVSGQGGGTSPALFQPPSAEQQVYVLLQGPALNQTLAGNYFKVKQIVLNDMKNITYNVLLEATSSIPEATFA